MPKTQAAQDFRNKIYAIIANDPERWHSTGSLALNLNEWLSDENARKRILYHCNELVKQGIVETRYSPQSRGWYQWHEFRLKGGKNA